MSLPGWQVFCTSVCQNLERPLAGLVLSPPLSACVAHVQKEHLDLRTHGNRH